MPESVPSTAPAAPAPWEALAPGWVPPVVARRRRRTVTALLAGTVLIVALATTAVVVLGGSSGAGAEALVVSSVQNSLAGRSAHMTVDLSGTAAGQALSATGSGDIDFAANAASFSIDMTAAGQQLSMQEVVVGQTIYIGGQLGAAALAQVAPGKSWMSVDLSSIASAAGQSAGSLGTGSNPAAMLRLLAERGNTVVPTGTSTVDGTTVQGYDVTFDPARIRSELSNPSLPSWIRQATSSVDFGHLTMQVFIDGANLLRQMRMDMHMSVAGHDVAISETTGFSDYGTPVTVTAPPPDEVLSVQQLLEASGQSSGQ